MIVPLAVSWLAFASNGWTALRGRPHGGRRTIQLAATVTGALGAGFHAYNIGKRPCGLSWHNLFYAAPPGAPAALTIAAALGASADSIAAGRPTGRVTTAMIASGLAGAAGEAWLLHFRGAFHNPAMWLPVTIPPVAATMLARDALAGRPGRDTRILLGATAALGVIGVGLHAWGVSRGMGGWRNWRQTVFAGPPLPAPPALTGLAIAGLGALMLLGRRRD